jgi:uroporphyrinogen decarboxylase
MKHRERVHLALNHEEPDRCPMQVSFTPEFAARLRRELGLTDADLHNPHGGGNTYALERALDEDMLLTSVGWANSYYATETYSQDGETYTDEWGITWKNVAYQTPFGTGRYTEMAGHPLADDRAIETYRPPDPNRPELYVEAERVIREFKDEYWIVGVTVTTIFETAWALRGYEKTLVDFALNPDFLERLLDIPFHYHLAAARKLVELGVDMIWTGDDVGAQNRMLIAPDTWRRFFKLRLANFIAALKDINPDIKVAYHSDGYIYPIIPDLIEIGLDVLNPIQPRSMDPARVKRDFGDRLCFWGSIDEQHTLPFGTPGDVAAEVKTRLTSLGRHGGLIIGPTHHVQLDTPMENFWAMIDTIIQSAGVGRGRGIGAV